MPLVPEIAERPFITRPAISTGSADAPSPVARLALFAIGRICLAVAERKSALIASVFAQFSGEFLVDATGIGA